MKETIIEGGPTNMVKKTIDKRGPIHEVKEIVSEGGPIDERASPKRINGWCNQQ